MIKSSIYPLFAAIILFAACQSTDRTLPIYGVRTPVETIVDGDTVVDTIYHTISDFHLLNQDSVYISNQDFDNKIYVANFFFTHCPSICPTMQRNLLTIYEEFKDNDQIAFLSHSIDFKYDSPSVLKAYAEKLGVTNQQWQFVNGEKSEIYGLAENYLVYTVEDENAPGGYDHQSYLVLIDKDKRIRGAYDGTELEQVKMLSQDIPVLLAEYK